VHRLDVVFVIVSEGTLGAARVDVIRNYLAPVLEWLATASEFNGRAATVLFYDLAIDKVSQCCRRAALSESSSVVGIFYSIDAGTDFGPAALLLERPLRLSSTAIKTTMNGTAFGAQHGRPFQ
jgi:hypothetical protein